MGLALGVLGLLASSESLRGQVSFQRGFEKQNKSSYRSFSALPLRTLCLCVILSLLANKVSYKVHFVVQCTNALCHPSKTR